jgi:hypothetical protein
VTAAVDGATCWMHIRPVCLLLPPVCCDAACNGAARSSARFALTRLGLQNEFQVKRYAAFLRLASSRESTSATIPSITV